MNGVAANLATTQSAEAQVLSEAQSGSNSGGACGDADGVVVDSGGTDGALGGVGGDAQSLQNGLNTVGGDLSGLQSDSASLAQDPAVTGGYNPGGPSPSSVAAAAASGEMDIAQSVSTANTEIVKAGDMATTAYQEAQAAQQAASAGSSDGPCGESPTTPSSVPAVSAPPGPSGGSGSTTTTS